MLIEPWPAVTSIFTLPGCWGGTLGILDLRGVMLARAVDVRAPAVKDLHGVGALGRAMGAEGSQQELPGLFALRADHPNSLLILFR
jgi:hypothetical protein